MTLVDYASSSDEQEREVLDAPPVAKRRRIETTPSSTTKSKDLPPLPSTFHDLYATSVRTSTSDNSALHGGRKRTTPHVVGNWPSHVYLEWYPTSTEVDRITTVLSSVDSLQKSVSKDNARLHSLLTSELGSPLPLHISLSASLSLSTAEKDGFLDVLSRALENLPQVSSFEVSLGDLLWAPNYDRSRWFLVLTTQKPREDELNLLLNCCNDVCEQQKLPVLYKKAKHGSSKGLKAARAEPLRQASAISGLEDDISDRFHFSIGWQLEEPNDRQMDFKGVDPAVLEDVKNIRVKIETVKVKIGNTIDSVALQRSKHNSGSILS